MALQPRATENDDLEWMMKNRMPTLNVRHKKMARLRGMIVALAAVTTLLCFVGCGNDDADATAASSSTADADEWWAVDAGPDVAQDAGQDGGGATGKDASSSVDQTCYDACIKKGQPASVCTPACGGSKGNGVDQVCYDGCIKKGASKDVCTNACAEKTPEVDKTCYDACIKNGKSQAVCTKICPVKGSGSTCYDSCVKAGGTAGTCKTDCSCHATCLKSGGDTKACDDKCLNGAGGGEPTYAQPCYDDCLKKGETKEVCQKACPGKGGGTLTADWATVHAKIIKPTCAGGYCHGGGSGSMKLTGDAAADFITLTTGKPGSKDAASCAAQAYVVAGKPAESQLWLKIDSKATQGCGDKMPPKSGGLSMELSDLVKDWITAGAKEK